MFNKLNILKIFFTSPTTKFSVRDIAKKANITPATASKQLKELAKDEFISYKKERAADLYCANLDSEVYRDLKVYYTIRKIKESGFINSINKQYLKPTIVLFGSAAKGLDTENSDFDIVVISEKTNEFTEHKKYELKLNRQIQIFNAKEISELKNKHLINNVLNGVILQGEILWI